MAFLSNYFLSILAGIQSIVKFYTNCSFIVCFGSDILYYSQCVSLIPKSIRRWIFSVCLFDIDNPENDSL